MKNRILALCLTVCMLMPAAALADEARFSLAGYIGTTDFFTRYEKVSGVKTDIAAYSEYAQWQAYKDAMVAGSVGELPDALFKAELTPSETIALLDAGTIIDLAPYIAEYCPNLNAALTAHPQWREAITMKDGRIGTLPLLTEQPAQNIVWVNQTWLKNVKMSMPEDAASFRAVLEAFKTGDPNRNGRADEVPLMFLGSFDLKFLAHAYGLVANDYNVYQQDGKVCYMPAQPAFRSFVQWLCDLYADGLMDVDGFSTSDQMRTNQFSDEKATNTCGMLISTTVSNVLPVSWASQYAAMPPLMYEGARVYRDFMGDVVRGTFAVTSACEDVAGMLGWVDAFYGETASVMAFIGEENVEYVVDGDGSWRVPEGYTSDPYKTAATLIEGAAFPALDPISFQMRYHDAAVRTLYEQIASINEYAVLPFPVYWLTQAQQDEVTAMQNVLGRYVDEQIARFVLGETELNDDTWQQFMNTLDEYGLPAFLAFWQDVLDNL